MVFLPVRGETLDGILQELVGAFFESGGLVRRLTATELCHALGDLRALVLADDVELERDALGALADAAPGCAFVFATDARRGWGDMRAIPLGGLPLDAAVELWEREAGPVEDPEARRAVDNNRSAPVEVWIPFGREGR